MTLDEVKKIREDAIKTKKNLSKVKDTLSRKKVRISDLIEIACKIETLCSMLLETEKRLSRSGK